MFANRKASPVHDEKTLPEFAELQSATAEVKELQAARSADETRLEELESRLAMADEAMSRVRAQLADAIDAESALALQKEMAATLAEKEALTTVKSNLKTRLGSTQAAESTARHRVRDSESRLSAAKARALLTPDILAVIHEAWRLMVESNIEHRYQPLPDWLAPPAIPTPPQEAGEPSPVPVGRGPVFVWSGSSPAPGMPVF